jgi:hypothetical protein
MGPIAWRKRASRIDVRHPSRFAQRLLDDLSQQRRFPAPTRADNLRQATARQPTARQTGIERFHTRAQRANIGASGSGERERKKIDERLWQHPVLSRFSDRQDCRRRRGE